MTDYITGVQYSDADIQQYIQEQNIQKYLVEGCIELAREKPAKPLQWLGQWLVKNNKKKPQIQAPKSKE